jgi:uncharacterized protein YciI
MQAPSESQALLRQMLQKPLFVAIRSCLDLSKVPGLLQEHLLWAIGAERRGELFASGPFVDDTSPPGALGGMSVLRAASLEEAQQIMAADPFIREGAYTATIRKWMLMEGGLTLTVRFSDQSYLLR